MFAADEPVRRQLGREYGDYDWDRWQKKAVAAGVPEALAQLGRDTMREAIQHSWPRDLEEECGCYDDGAAMLRLALEKPDEAGKRWQHLLETDGERGYWDPKTNEWISHP